MKIQKDTVILTSGKKINIHRADKILDCFLSTGIDQLWYAFKADDKGEKFIYICEGDHFNEKVEPEKLMNLQRANRHMKDTLQKIKDMI